MTHDKTGISLGIRYFRVQKNLRAGTAFGAALVMFFDAMLDGFCAAGQSHGRRVTVPCPAKAGGKWRAPPSPLVAANCDFNSATSCSVCTNEKPSGNLPQLFSCSAGGPDPRR